MNLLNRTKERTLDDLAIEVAVEYKAPHWVVYVADPGTKSFKPLRNKERALPVYDDYGLEKSKFFPIMTFANIAAVQKHVDETMPNARLVKRKKPGMFSLSTE